MNKKEKAVQVMLFLAGSFFLILSLIHLSDIRFLDINSIVWPNSAITYGKHITRLFGSFSLALAIMAFAASKKPSHYKTLILLSGLWGIFHALLLIFNSSTMLFDFDFRQLPSLRVWLPSYNINAYIEAGVSLFYSCIIFNWIIGSKR